MSSGSEQRAWIVIAQQQQHLSKGWLAITRAQPPDFLPTPDHRRHTYPSSVHTPPAHTASSLTADRGREDGAIPGPQCSQTISGTKGILVRETHSMRLTYWTRCDCFEYSKFTVHVCVSPALPVYVESSANLLYVYSVLTNASVDTLNK